MYVNFSNQKQILQLSPEKKKIVRLNLLKLQRQKQLELQKQKQSQKSYDDFASLMLNIISLNAENPSRIINSNSQDIEIYKQINNDVNCDKTIILFSVTIS
jgi:hypothetical protein